MTLTTWSPEILVKVLREEEADPFLGYKLGAGDKLIGESSIHRLDPRSRKKCAYALSSKDYPHPGGTELVVFEGPPGQYG